MNNLEVRIEGLEAMRVATFRAVSRNPEDEAWAKLKAWAEPRGLLNHTALRPIFGFNNPSPMREGQEYGYELWIRVGPDVTSEGEVKVKDFPGGLYAVVTHQGLPNPQIWRALKEWVEASDYRRRPTHELEKVRNPFAPLSELIFDLYFPIEV